MSHAVGETTFNIVDNIGTTTITSGAGSKTNTLVKYKSLIEDETAGADETEEEEKHPLDEDEPSANSVIRFDEPEVSTNTNPADDSLRVVDIADVEFDEDPTVIHSPQPMNAQKSQLPDVSELDLQVDNVMSPKLVSEGTNAHRYAYNQPSSSSQPPTRTSLVTTSATPMTFSTDTTKLTDLESKVQELQQTNEHLERRLMHQKRRDNVQVQKVKVCSQQIWLNAMIAN